MQSNEKGFNRHRYMQGTDLPGRLPVYEISHSEFTGHRQPVRNTLSDHDILEDLHTGTRSACLTSLMLERLRTIAR